MMVKYANGLRRVARIFGTVLQVGRVVVYLPEKDLLALVHDAAKVMFAVRIVVVGEHVGKKRR